jgi:hypothetical protein
MNEHDNAYVDAMHMVNMQANTRSVTKQFRRRCRGERWFAEITLSLTTSVYSYIYLFLSFYSLFSLLLPYGK